MNSVNEKKDEVIIDFLNVGFGECTVVRVATPQPKVIVIDGGDDSQSIYARDPKRIQLIDYLKKEDISIIDLLVITHPHPDHVSGLVKMLELDQLIIQEVCCHLTVSAIENEQLDKVHPNVAKGLGSLRMMLAYFERENVKLTLISEREKRLIGPLKIEIFPPVLAKVERMQEKINRLADVDEADELKKLANEIDYGLNELSLSMKLTAFDKVVFITADALLERLQSMVALEPENRVNILQAPHHGDRKHLSAEFLESANPELIIVSADDEGTYSLPSHDFEAFVYNVLPNVNIHYTASDKNGMKHRGIRIQLTDEKSTIQSYLK